MLTRKDFEKLEENNLVSYACKSGKSLGRVYPEEEDDFRTAFQRDRDRIIHSRAFRRLKHKTQVFVAPEGDHYRTRLTHTLEVAQIARQLARLLKLNEDLVEAISLAHDLGHPPFGHAGEQALNELMKNYGGFEHNYQSRRIVEELEDRYPNFRGLNLTREVLEGLVKHQTPWDKPLFPREKKSPTLEAQMVNIADEIAYNNHDLDDGLMANFLDLKDLERNVDLWNDAIRYLRKNFAKKSFLCLEKKRLIFLEVRYLINQQIIDLAQETERNINKFKIENLDDVYKCQKDIVSFSANMLKKNRQLRKYLKDKFYFHPRILKKNKEAQKKLKTIFLTYVQQKTAPALFIKESLKRGTSLPQAVCDYIAGMTDNFALRAYSPL